MPDLDAEARRVAFGRGALDLAIGETLVRFLERGGPARFNHARAGDYASERLGISETLMKQFRRLAKVLETRPILERAVRCGEVTKNKALAIAAAAKGEDEAQWTAAAMHLSLVELKQRLKADGHDPRADTFEIESIVLQMDGQEQDRLDAGIELARQQNGADTPRFALIEIICQEYLGACGPYEPWEGQTKPTRIPLPDLEVCLGEPIPIEEAAGDDVVALDRHLRKLIRLRDEREVELGRLLVEIETAGIHKEHGFRDLFDYCTDRLGISVTKMRVRMALERDFVRFPQLREAVASGRLSLRKARLVARWACESNIEERIEEAATTTQQQTDQDATTTEDAHNRALGIRRIWGPVDCAETILTAIHTYRMQSIRGHRRWVSEGTALAEIADYFVGVWTRHRLIERERERSRKKSKKARMREKVYTRCGGLCAHPGCKRKAVHAHHLIHRARGGPDEIWNLVGLCAFHHLQSVHGGHVTVEGDAEVELTFVSHLPCGYDERWRTTPDGRATRVDVAPELAMAGGR